MAYVDYEYYSNLYSNAVDEATFNRLLYIAEKRLDREVTGVDGVNKLKDAFPKDEPSIEAVKRCVCAVLTLMNRLDEAERNGTERTVASISAGGESISYVNTQSDFEKAVSNAIERDKMYERTIYEYLVGVTDCNGVQLLYLGVYPM